MKIPKPIKWIPRAGKMMDSIIWGNQEDPQGEAVDKATKAQEEMDDELERERQEHEFSKHADFSEPNLEDY